MDREFVEIPKKDNGKRVERSLGMKKALYRLFHSISWMLNLFVLLLYLLAQLSTILSPEQLFFSGTFWLGLSRFVGRSLFFPSLQTRKASVERFLFQPYLLGAYMGFHKHLFPITL